MLLRNDEQAAIMSQIVKFIYSSMFVYVGI